MMCKTRERLKCEKDPAWISGRIFCAESRGILGVFLNMKI